jgi:hypothetical protein
MCAVIVCGCVFLFLAVAHISPEGSVMAMEAFLEILKKNFWRKLTGGGAMLLHDPLLSSGGVNPPPALLVLGVSV